MDTVGEEMRGLFGIEVKPVHRLLPAKRVLGPTVYGGQSRNEHDFIFNESDSHLWEFSLKWLEPNRWHRNGLKPDNSEKTHEWVLAFGMKKMVARSVAVP